MVVVVNTDPYEGKIKKILSLIRNDWMVLFHTVFIFTTFHKFL